MFFLAVGGCFFCFLLGSSNGFLPLKFSPLRSFRRKAFSRAPLQHERKTRYAPIFCFT